MQGIKDLYENHDLYDLKIPVSGTISIVPSPFNAFNKFQISYYPQFDIEIIKV